VNPTGRFTDRAADYAAGRPSYPDAALDAIFTGMGDPATLTIADLGAGTGISSRILADRGARVLAIEPNAAMRESAVPHERVTFVAATAEATGLEEADVDVVTVFQAFHWFDHRRALREIVRILRPGGRAAAVYNERDESDAFTAEYGELVRRYHTDDTELRRADGLEAFIAFEGWHAPRTVRVSNAQELDREGLLARARSTSYLPKEGRSAGELYAELERLFVRYARDGHVTMALQTIVARGDTGGDGG
jgi:SAM-dependent methyltransferase